MGACSSSMGVFNNYAIVPADKFMPVDVHVPGCPPRPEALMHGILKLRKQIQDDPDTGWRERYGAYGTEELLPDDDGVAPAINVREPTTGCRVPDATRPRADRRRPARRGDACSARSSSASKATLLVARRARARARSSTCASKGFTFLASVHGVDYFPEEPRLGVHYELLDMHAVDRITVKTRVHTEDPHVPSVTQRVADRQPPGARDLRHVRRRLRRPPGPAPHPDARRLRGPPAAARLPDRRRAGPLHAQRGRRRPGWWK